MASQVTNYKCLSCTADLKFSASTGKLESKPLELSFSEDNYLRTEESSRRIEQKQ